MRKIFSIVLLVSTLFGGNEFALDEQNRFEIKKMIIKVDSKPTLEILKKAKVCYSHVKTKQEAANCEAAMVKSLYLHDKEVLGLNDDEMLFDEAPIVLDGNSIWSKEEKEETLFTLNIVMDKLNADIKCIKTSTNLKEFDNCMREKLGI